MHAGSFTVDSCLCCAKCLKQCASAPLAPPCLGECRMLLTCSLCSCPNSIVFLGKQGSSLGQIWGFLCFPGISGPTYAITIRLCISHLCFLGLRLISLFNMWVYSFNKFVLFSEFLLFLFVLPSSGTPVVYIMLLWIVPKISDAIFIFFRHFLLCAFYFE